MVKIVHLTSVHPPFDTRIFYKECKTLASAGYDVVLIAPHDRSEIVDEVKVHPIPLPKNRRQRVIQTVPQVYKAALEENADIYHFHDPELIPVGWMLKQRGKHVVYDVHEDYGTAIRQKPYLPNWFRFLLSSLWNKIELFSARSFHVVLAENYYRQRFPDGVTILNYPLRQIFSGQAIQAGFVPSLLYTGVISEDRGALIHAQLVRFIPEIEVHIAGRCSESLKERMLAAAGSAKERLYLEVSEKGIPYPKIMSYYRQEWMAGLALFPPTPHYMQKELTKFFEYMGAGIPIVCSDFPVWRDLVAGNECGLCVDPEDPVAIAEAISWLLEHPAEAQAMGERGRQAVIEQYNWNMQGYKLLDFYENLLKCTD
jgi:glycosyltransferase involved in cell wall biosynthesis